MPPIIPLRLVLILSFFLIAGPLALMFSPINAGFGTGFVAAAVIIFLYRIVLLRRFERNAHLKGAPYGIAAGRAAYSTLSIFAILACATAFIAAALQTGAEIDAFRFLGVLTSVLFLLFVWLFWYYQSQITEL